jgi:hypothetical protein
VRMVLFIVIALIFGCTNTEAETATRRALEGAGYTNIELRGFSWGGCAEDDVSCTEFAATGPSGISVTGAVGCRSSLSGCSIKGCTIRTF